MRGVCGQPAAWIGNDGDAERAGLHYKAKTTPCQASLKIQRHGRQA